ncbi:cytochrome b/b6 domain-containing protein [Pedobacter sp. L105]|uniref:cytochrome b/b6 domain-containing protein n=1 Tax=Pedobacter sp. L105 TaxID=1641871 RepID=UPI00131EAB5F|nr:cytochrome b/b6 domain-containing protein [Pedobacter sp. L105]
MPTIEPIRRDVENEQHIKKHSAAIRFWHWMNALIITGSLVTVVINSTLFEDPSIRSTVQGKSILHTLEDKVWGIHIYFGYALAALFLFRIFQELFLRSDQKFLYKLKVVYSDYFVINKNREPAKHDLVVKILYIIFYMLLAIMVGTGLTLAFGDQFGLPKSILHAVKNFHGFCMYLIIVFVLLHVAGVILAEKKSGSGIVSDMINGGKQ